MGRVRTPPRTFSASRTTTHAATTPGSATLTYTRRARNATPLARTQDEVCEPGDSKRDSASVSAKPYAMASESASGATTSRPGAHHRRALIAASR